MLLLDNQQLDPETQTGPSVDSARLELRMDLHAEVYWASQTGTSTALLCWVHISKQINCLECNHQLNRSRSTGPTERVQVNWTIIIVTWGSQMKNGQHHCMKRLCLTVWHLFSCEAVTSLHVPDKHRHACQPAARLTGNELNISVPWWRTGLMYCYEVVSAPALSSKDDLPCYHCDITAALLFLSHGPTEWKQKHLRSLCVSPSNFTSVRFLWQHDERFYEHRNKLMDTFSSRLSPQWCYTHKSSCVLVWFQSRWTQFWWRLCSCVASVKLETACFVIPVFSLQNVYHNNDVCGCLSCDEVLTSPSPPPQPFAGTVLRDVLQVNLTNWFVSLFVFCAFREQTNLFCHMKKNHLNEAWWMKEDAPKKQTNLWVNRLFLYSFTDGSFLLIEWLPLIFLIHWLDGCCNPNSSLVKAFNLKTQIQIQMKSNPEPNQVLTFWAG